MRTHTLLACDLFAVARQADRFNAACPWVKSPAARVTHEESEEHVMLRSGMGGVLQHGWKSWRYRSAFGTCGIPAFRTQRECSLVWVDHNGITDRKVRSMIALLSGGADPAEGAAGQESPDTGPFGTDDQAVFSERPNGLPSSSGVSREASEIPQPPLNHCSSANDSDWRSPLAQQ